MRTYEPTPLTRDYYVPMTQFTTPSQVVDPPKVNVERTPAISEHEDVPINNEHQEIVEEPAEVTQDQTTDGTSEVEQEQEVEPAPAVEPQPLRRSG